MNEYPATLSIDLGASYTKVSYRPSVAPTRAGPSDKEAKILMIDGSPLIPSLAIYTGKARQPWLFGHIAAQTKPSADMRVFVNWKSHFFRQENDELTVEAVVIAGKFFAWLRDQVEDGVVELARTETRVAMPAFKGFETKAQMLARCMELNGWQAPKILRTTEPHANTIGLFSNGKNVVGRAPNGDLLLQYNRMFGQNIYIRKARDMIIAGANPAFKVLIVDIGAFTTDLAALTFDTRAEDDGVQNVEPESHALGIINELDRGLFRAIGQRHGFDWARLSFEESEAAKTKLYQGETAALLLTEFSGEIGDAKDQKLVTEHTNTFAERVWETIRQIVEKEKPGTVFLTGGGSLVAPVTARLTKRLRDAGIPLARVREQEPANGNAKWRSWDETGEGLARLATALGGASVILQDGGLQRRHEPFGPVEIPEPIDNYIHCSCLGGNKDCCKCSGAGYYKRS